MNSSKVNVEDEKPTKMENVMNIDQIWQINETFS